MGEHACSAALDVDACDTGAPDLCPAMLIEGEAGAGIGTLGELWNGGGAARLLVVEVDFAEEGSSIGLCRNRACNLRWP